MYSVVSAKKGSYDSNIKISVLKVAKNKPLAIKECIDILTGEMMTRMTDLDYSLYEYLLDDEDALKEAIKKDIEEKIDKKEKKLFYEEGYSYIQLDYNKAKIFSGYTIPCSSLNEYQAETVAIISGQ